MARFPAGLIDCSWLCITTGGGSCDAPSGAGDVDLGVDLPAGTSVVVQGTCTVDPFFAGSQLDNTATLALPGIFVDLDTADNGATDSNTVSRLADLRVEKTDGVTLAKVGGSLTYTIAVTNDGPSGAAGATVSDTFPAELANCAWTCAPSGGATCGLVGPVAANLADTPTLPPGDSVTYVATCDATSAGTVVNTASVAPPSGVSDPAAGNDAAPDTTEVTTCGKENHQVLSAQTVTGTQLFEVCQTLTAENAFVVGATADVTLRAGQKVILGDGFSVEEGASFMVELDPTLAGGGG